MSYDREACSRTILDRLTAGEPLTIICKTEGLPAASTFLGWCDEDVSLAEQYARATQLGYDAMADEALQEAKDATDPAKGRLAFDARRWWLGKRHPKKYGERTILAGDKDAPIETNTKVTRDWSDAPDEVLRWLASQKA